MLPPGQIETRLFPVVGERQPSSALDDPSRWVCHIRGMVETERVLDLDEVFRLGTHQLTFDIHCVTSWTRRAATFTGFPLADVVAPGEGARFVSFTAYSDRGHHTSLPLDYALEHSFIAHSFDGEPLTSEHGGPVRVVTPGKYFYKSIKWLEGIDLLADDRLGWWETESSYHNVADPWTGDQRFTTGSLRPEQLRRFREAVRYDKYRGRVMLGLDLRGWAPESQDLRRLYLKNCDMRQADLTGADLRESNLSLSNLGGAGLAGADLSGSDLEGASFEGADLSGADLSDTALSATRFEGARVDGARFDGVSGLVESQREYLVDQGIDL